MKLLKLETGKYVLAVSGGVDSVVLLDSLISKTKGLELIVAHFNHGIREDSHEDEQLVRTLAAANNLKLEVGYGHLGRHASEELARQKRYEFLSGVKKKHKAKAVITAHHQDDLIETAFLNILRGTGHRGLTAILLNPKVKRPLINVSKREIIACAKKRELRWREDYTNLDIKYLRNYVRKVLIPKLNSEDRKQIIKIIYKVAKNQRQLEELIANLSQTISQNNKIERSKFTTLPLEIRNELIVFWLRQRHLSEFDKRTIERLNLAIKAAPAGKKHAVKNDLWLKISPSTVELTKVP